MTLGPAYFDAMYAASPDPWGFAERWYEQRKHALSVAMLPRRAYAGAFEPGCSIGVLTGLLAARCGRLLSCDLAGAAVRAAAERTRGLPNVRVERRSIPDDWPPGEFDLIVLSEFLYYFGGADLDRVLDLAVKSTRDGGTLLAVHWLHPVAEYPSGGEEVHGRLAARAGIARLAQHRERDFLAEVYIRTDGEPRSVAQSTGLV
ncbi:MAG TPA: SAM-dependent methyltransferase [Streptosporangiaceae bacterium]